MTKGFSTRTQALREIADQLKYAIVNDKEATLSALGYLFVNSKAVPEMVRDYYHNRLKAIEEAVFSGDAKKALEHTSYLLSLEKDIARRKAA